MSMDLPQEDRDWLGAGAPVIQLLEDLRGFQSEETAAYTEWLPRPLPSSVPAGNAAGMPARDCLLFRLKELSHDSERPRREALENVFATFGDESANFVYLLCGTRRGVEIYLGVARDYESPPHTLHAWDQGEQLRGCFLGNFGGSELEVVNDDAELEERIYSPIARSTRGSVILGVPSINESDARDDQEFQGLDRLINSMAGTKGDWQLLVVCRPVPPDGIRFLKSRIYALYDRLHQTAQMTIQRQSTRGTSASESNGRNENRTKTRGTNVSKSRSSGTQISGSTSGSSSSTGTSDSVAVAEGSSTQSTTGSTEGTSRNVSVEIINKRHQELLRYIDEELLPRMNLGQAKGLFSTAVYALAENRATHVRLVRSIMAISQGDQSQFSPLRSVDFPETMAKDAAVGLTKQMRQRALCNFQGMRTAFSGDGYLPLLFGQPFDPEAALVELSTYLTAREITMVAALPTREVPGVSIREGVDFGLNPASSDDGVKLGRVLHHGRELPDSVVRVPTTVLNQHVFVAGVTGSGKTTTCQKLLGESELPFLVIEPAKTEYRALLATIPPGDMQLYTLGNERVAPFRLNPFELLPGESLTSHIDMLKAAFSAAFPMEAAMPYILEEAIYEVYHAYGWQTWGWPDQNTNPWEASGRYWPTMTDLLASLEVVVADKKFSARLADDYRASLISRFQNLTIGAKGRMLNCRCSVDFRVLLRSKVVLELDELRDPQDKAFLMGLILGRLTEALRLEHAENHDFRHLTLVEEAHRLLAKVDPGEGGPRAHAVAIFTDLLAEVRKYGEGLLIADQIPSKLAPEVLKNTNTKVIHTLFARDDRESIGDTMSMDDAQKAHLARLRVGEVVMFCRGWRKPVWTKVAKATDTQQPSNELHQQALARGEEQLTEQQQLYFPALGSQDIRLSKDGLAKYAQCVRRLGGAVADALSKHPAARYKNAPDERFTRLAADLAPIGEELRDSYSNVGIAPDQMTALLTTELAGSLPRARAKQYTEPTAGELVHGFVLRLLTGDSGQLAGLFSSQNPDLRGCDILEILAEVARSNR